jgi:hypothetical protein
VRDGRIAGSAMRVRKYGAGGKLPERQCCLGSVQFGQFCPNGHVRFGFRGHVGLRLRCGRRREVQRRKRRRCRSTVQQREFRSGKLQQRCFGRGKMQRRKLGKMTAGRARLRIHGKG